MTTPVAATPGSNRASNRADLFRALAILAEPPTERQPAIAAALGLEGRPRDGDYADVFLFNAYPYASVYLGAEGMLGGEARDRVAGFWRALGLTPPAEPDHLAALLGLYASLVDAGAPGSAHGVLRQESRRACLWEHLVSWLPPYLDKLRELAPPFYAAWAELLAELLRSEAAELGPADRLPLQLREAPGLPALDADPDAWLAALVAPVRSGVLVTRWDLRRAAADIGLGVRAGERAFMLRSLFDQDPRAVAGWLAEAARRAAVRAAGDTGFGPVAEFWRARADATAEALDRGVAELDRHRSPAVGVDP